MHRYRPHNTAEAEVTGRSIDRLGHPGCWPVAPAVVRRAQEGPALHHLARDLYLWHARVIAVLPLPALRIDAAAAGMRELAVLLVPVCRPLPDVARHVKQPVPIRPERPHWRRALVPIGPQVLPGKLALPGVRHHPATRGEFLSPDVGRTVQSPTRRELPFRLGRQRFPSPPGIGFDVLVGDVHHRMVRPPLYRTGWSFRMAPVRARDIRPPVVVVAQVDPVARFL